MPVQIKLYITGAGQMPSRYKTLESDIREKLDEYSQPPEACSSTRCTIPQGDQEMQDALTGRGIQAFVEQSIEKDEMSAKLIWSAMTIAYLDRPLEVMPQLRVEQMPIFEYDVMLRIQRLLRERDPIVAMVAPKQEVDQQTAFQYLAQGMQPPPPVDKYRGVEQVLGQLRNDVRRVELSESSPLPADADVLLVLNPRDLNARQAYEINRALSNGMNTMIAVQMHEYSHQVAGAGQISVATRSFRTGLDGMLEEFGCGLNNDHLFDMHCPSISMPVAAGRGRIAFESFKLPFLINLNGEQMDRDVPLTSQLSSLQLNGATVLETDPSRMADLGLEATTLITTSDKAWRNPYSDGLVPASHLDPGLAEVEPGLPLAMMIQGEFPDAFAGTEAPAWPAADPQAPTPPQPESDAGPAPLVPAQAKLLLMGAASLFDDENIRNEQNMLALINAVDALAGSDDLAKIRSKALFRPRINEVSEQAKLGYKLFVLVLVPLLIIGYGFMRAASRRKEVTR